MTASPNDLPATRPGARVWALILSIALVACAHGDRLPTTPLTVGGVRIQAEVADEPHERAQGLQFRKKLGADAGMLFVYDGEAERSFWMEYTTIPLSIAFMDSGGVIFHMADMRPLDRTSIPSMKPAQFALEMNQGWFVAHDIGLGAQVEGLPQSGGG